MAQQEDGWPLGLQPLSVRVGLLRHRDRNGSVSFKTLLTGSPSFSTDFYSSDLDTEVRFPLVLSSHDKSITLGSLIGISSILELSQRSIRRRTAETFRSKKSSKSTWLFSLCSKLRTDAVSMSNTPSLGHFLGAERKASTNYRRNQSQNTHVPDDFSDLVPISESSSLLISGQIASPQSITWFRSEGERRSNSGLLEHGQEHGAPLLFSCFCGQLAH
ncbi:unnamed protein product [Ilex paraguariensis]|uniref:Uncharacterized protein n=1 Tax=Ilex paraguariensis TaxID=185542 RepID=A0ABC8V4B0_9AQUA